MNVDHEAHKALHELLAVESTTAWMRVVVTLGIGVIAALLDISAAITYVKEKD